MHIEGIPADIEWFTLTRKLCCEYSMVIYSFRNQSIVGATNAHARTLRRQLIQKNSFIATTNLFVVPCDYFLLVHSRDT